MFSTKSFPVFRSRSIRGKATNRDYFCFFLQNKDSFMKREARMGSEAAGEAIEAAALGGSAVEGIATTMQCSSVSDVPGEERGEEREEEMQDQMERLRALDSVLTRQLDELDGVVPASLAHTTLSQAQRKHALLRCVQDSVELTPCHPASHDRRHLMRSSTQTLPDPPIDSRAHTQMCERDRGTAPVF